MKRLLVFLATALIIISLDAHPVKIDRHMSGSWYNRDQDGHGFNIEVINENLSVFYWYVYNPDGTPTWLVGTGTHDEEGQINGVAYHNTGMRWGVFNPLERTQERWGVVTIDFHDCNHAGVYYESDDLFEKNIPYGFGYVEVERLTSIRDSKCAENPFPGIYKGYFWSDSMEQSFPGTVLIDGQGGFLGFSRGHRSFSGTRVIDGEEFIAEGSTYRTHTGEAESITFTAEGQIKAEYRLHTEYQVVGVDNGYADLYPVTQLYWRGVTLAELAGDYEVEELLGFTFGTASISVDGAVTGVDSAGCAWSGQVAIPDVQFNMFHVELTVSNCGDSNAFYEGKGFLDDARDLDDRMAVRFYSFNDSKALPVSMTRLVP